MNFYILKKEINLIKKEMSTVSYQISLSYNQIRELVNQLPFKDKARLSEELARETKDKVITRLLESFRTNDIEQRDIDEEVENVRAEIYAKNKKDKSNH